ncbi:MAG: Holliday junction resolvase RuvX [Chloroflexi bacterium]|nr:Holliday junction resolvase RuvX [Chloroflexota bacterium]
MSSYLALDVGDERIGVALSDANGTLARPLEIILRSRGSSSFLRICKIINQYQVERIIVGWPLLLDGSEGKQTLSVSAYLRGLKTYTELPIVLWDERLSTREADDIMQANDLSKHAQKRRRDAVAAAVILQQYLDQLAEGTEA